jgi:hypothetical protein
MKLEKKQTPDGRSYQEVRVEGTLVNVVAEPKTNKVTGNLYHTGNATVTLPNGDVRTTPCIIPKGNYDKGMEVGTKYVGHLREMIDEKGNPILNEAGSPQYMLTLSHLIPATLLSFADLGIGAPAEPKAKGKLDIVE